MRFRTILADPPWRFRVRALTDGTRAASRHYACMDTAEIAALRVQDVSAASCALLLWATWPMLPDAISVMAAWGFEYKTAMPWLKMSRGGCIQMGTGYQVRACSEVLLIGARGVGARPAPGMQPLGVITEEAPVLLHPRGPHSAKPDYQYHLAEYWPAPYLELFARPDGGLDVPRAEWTRVGLEMTGRPMDEDIRLLAAMPDKSTETP